MASSSELDKRPAVDPHEEPSHEWGWHGTLPKGTRIAGWLSAGFCFLMLIGNHHGQTENIYLIADAEAKTTKLAIGADHAGFALKQHLVAALVRLVRALGAFYRNADAAARRAIEASDWRISFPVEIRVPHDASDLSSAGTSRSVCQPVFAEKLIRGAHWTCTRSFSKSSGELSTGSRPRPSRNFFWNNF